MTAADHQLLSRRANNGAHPRACQAADGTSSSSATNGNWSGTGNEQISGADYCSPVVMVMVMSLQRAARLQPRDVATSYVARAAGCALGPARTHSPSRLWARLVRLVCTSRCRSQHCKLSVSGLPSHWNFCHGVSRSLCCRFHRSDCNAPLTAVLCY